MKILVFIVYFVCSTLYSRSTNAYAAGPMPYYTSGSPELTTQPSQLWTNTGKSLNFKLYEVDI